MFGTKMTSSLPSPNEENIPLDDVDEEITPCVDKRTPQIPIYYEENDKYAAFDTDQFWGAAIDC